ncbi:MULTISPECIES: hypothetical protein [unclassified Streptomyces]|uniref:hypothetical protein n=1 Tax=unclassified Streptomyces TaxID=2593676 RepID=UPI00324ECB1F
MLLPYPVLEYLSASEIDRWDAYFAGRHDRARSIEEGIWRRTQEPQNAAQSGWGCDGDRRRRVVHYRYGYALDYTHPMPRLVLDTFYLHHSVSAPVAELELHRQSIYDSLQAGWDPKGRKAWSRGDLNVTVNEYEIHPQDIRARRRLPDDYRSVDVCFTSEGNLVPRPVQNLPWDVLAGGMRIKEQRGNPHIVNDLSLLLDHLPFQIEVGCGTSIEAGIPPLHRLHEVYRVTDRQDNALGQDYQFTFTKGADPLVEEVLRAPEDKFSDFVEMFAACFSARPTSAHHALKQMSDCGALVGPVITNNFDLLSARAGLEECFVRRYDQKIPPVPILPEAKALLVVGNHADRRQVQKRAREAGMKIFFVDPEGLMEHGRWIDYPVEGAREGDLLCRQAASPALADLARRLGLAPTPAV